MTELLPIAGAAALSGGYISPFKLLAMLVGFFLWMPVLNWVYKDAQEVQTQERKWTAAVLISGSLGLLLWLLVPVFWIGLPLFIVTLGGTMLAYVIHRNARVADFEKVLTTEHIRSLFINEVKRLEKASHGLTLITANGNEVPLPDPKTPEAQGFRIFCETFADALWRRASDIFFQPGAQEYAVSYLVDGMTIKQPARSREDMEFFIRFIKQLADLEIDERRKPQSGTFKIVKGDETPITWEVTTAGSTAGEQVKVTKAHQYGTMTVDDLGFSATQLEAVRGLREVDEGVVLVTAPAKNGLTTTLYALLRNHDLFMNNVNTLEKRPAADLQNITQHTYSLTDTGTTTYARRLQSVLRTGPDILGVAECEGPECAKIASSAVKDSVLVYAAFNADSVIQALSKWLEWVGDKRAVIDSLAGIINQRLIRILCEECRQAYQPNQELFRKFNIPADKIKVLYRPGEIEYDKHGKPIVCEKCQGTGFYGRTGVFEMIRIDDRLRQALAKATSVREMAACFRKAGMLYLQEECIKKVAQGVTSINEVIRHFSPKQKAAVKSKEG